MIYPWWCWVFSISGMIADAVVICILMQRKQTGKWRSVLALCIFDLCVGLALDSQHHIYKRYFYMFWFSSYIRPFLRLWVVGDIVKSFPGADFIPERVWLFLYGFGGAVGLGLLYLTFTDGVQFTEIVGRALIVDRSCNYAILGFYAFLLGSIKLSGLAWSRTGSMVAHGLSVQVVISTLAPFLLSFFSHPYRIFANALSFSGSIVTLSLWAAAMYSEDLSNPFLFPRKENA